MNDIFQECPTYENEVVTLRPLVKADASALLNCYSDNKAVPFFNSDNCHGDTFYYPTIEKMEAAVDFWIIAYEKKYFVRWTVLYSVTKEIIGTVEMCHRIASDDLNHAGILRIDLRSSFENEKIIANILKIVNANCYDSFNADFIITKAIPSAHQRIKALLKNGYTLSEKKPLSYEGIPFNDYYIRNK